MRFRKQYQRVNRHGSRFVGKWIIAEICSTRSQQPRLGITVTKKFGKAHQRNRFKRIVREAFRLSSTEWGTPVDIVIRPRSEALSASSLEIRQELMELVDQQLRLKDS